MYLLACFSVLSSVEPDPTRRSLSTRSLGRRQDCKALGSRRVWGGAVHSRISMLVARLVNNSASIANFGYPAFHTRVAEGYWAQIEGLSHCKNVGVVFVHLGAI